MKGDRPPVAFLQKIPIFQGFAADELARVVPLFSRRAFDKGQIIFMKDDPGDTLYLIRRGAVKIYLTTPDGGEKTLALLREGEFFGEMALLEDAPRSAMAEALEPCELLTLEKREFTALLLKHPTMALKIIRVLCERLRRMNAQVEALCSQDARSRILGALIELAERHGHDVPGGRRIEWKLTHQELANLAATSRETVTRLLCGLQDEGVLTVEGRHIILRNVAEMRARLTEAS